MAGENVIPELVLNAFHNCGKYKVIKSLGYGAYGRVFLVHDKMTEKKVAAKVVATATTNELNIWPSLDHHNILTLYRTDSIPLNSFVFITPYEGPDLFYMLYEKQPDFHEDMLCFDRKHKYMLHVLKGLEYLHGRNLCHLDLREENILIRPCSNTAVIGDFSTLVYSEEVKNQQFGLHFKALPPETVNREQISYDFDGTAAEMWTYGFLVLQVFTKQYITRHTPANEPYEEFLPKLLLATFNNNVEAAFCEQHSKTFVSERMKNLLFDFIENLIVMEPKSRMIAKEALEHPFMASIKTESPNSLGEKLDLLIKEEFDSTVKKNESFMSQFRKSFSRMNLVKSHMDLKNAKDFRNPRSLETTALQDELKLQENAPKRTRTLPKNFLVLTTNGSNCSERHGSHDSKDGSAIQELPDYPSKSKVKPLEKSIHTTVSHFSFTGEIETVLENQIGDHVVPAPCLRPKWTDSFVKLFSRSKKSKTECEPDIVNPFCDIAVEGLLDVGTVEFTAKGKMCEKPKRRWYWSLRAFGRMFSRGKLFKKRQKIAIAKEEKLNLM